MAGSVNKVILVGNLGADPEIRRTQDGRPIANLRIATSETWRDKGTGERKEKTEWHRVVIFNEGLCKVAEQYLKKGAKVYIEGALQTRKWTDQSGVEKFSTEVVLQGFNSTLTMLDGRGGGGGGFSDDAGGDFGSSGVSSPAPRRAVSGGGGGGGGGPVTTSFSTLARPVETLTRPPAAISVLPTATLAVNERASFSDGTGSQVFVATSYLDTSASPSKDGRFVPPIEYSCPATTARPGVFFAIGISANSSTAVHAFVTGSKPQVLLSTSSGFVRPPDK